MLLKKEFSKLSKKMALGVSALLLSGTALAGGVEQPSPGGVYFSMLGGVNWEYSGQNAFVNLGGITTNLYQASKVSTTGPLVGFDIGYAWMMSQNVWVALGGESSYTRVISPAGLVRPLFLVNPGFDTLNFTYAVSSVPIFAVFKLGFTVWHYGLYVLAGAGIAWNKAYNYNEVPTIPSRTALPMRAMYRSNTEADFAYTAGLGILFNLTASTCLGIEYRFTNYGDASLSPTTQQTTTQGLSLGEVRSNALLARLTVKWHSM